MRKRRQLGASATRHNLEHAALYERAIFNAGVAINHAHGGYCADALDSLLTAQDFLAAGNTELIHSSGWNKFQREHDSAQTWRDRARHSIVDRCLRSK